MSFFFIIHMNSKEEKKKERERKERERKERDRREKLREAARIKRDEEELQLRLQRQAGIILNFNEDSNTTECADKEDEDKTERMEVDDDDRTLVVDEASMDVSKSVHEDDDGEKAEGDREGKKDEDDEHHNLDDEEGDGFIRSDVPRGMSRWRRSVADCSSAAQLYICIIMLDRCIAWDKSIMKAVSILSYMPESFHSVV